MPSIEFRGYTNDSLIHGVLGVPDEFRLTDFLNRSTVLPIANATSYALHDGGATPMGDIELNLADISAVQPTDSGMTAWHSDLRVSTRSVQVEVEMSPYLITGFLHGHASGDPIPAMGHSRAMVPLTDAVIRFRFRGRPVARATRVLIINRDRVLRIHRVASEAATPNHARTAEPATSITAG